MMAARPSKDLLVSVITPTLNRCASLLRTLDSVAEQDHTNIEHIVIDGGSTDGTIAILRDYEKRRGLIWISEPDGGVYSAVNKGLSRARGDILCYLNSDDSYFPYSISAAVERLSNSQAGFVYGDLLRFDESKSRGMLLFYPPYRRPYLERGNVIAQPTVFWKREAFVKAGLFDEGLRLAADMDFWVRMGRHFTGEHVDEVLAYEGHHEGRLTSGSVAREQGKVELASIRARHGHRGGPFQPYRWLDLLRGAYHYRRQVLRFLWHAGADSAGSRGPWNGFRRASAFTVDRRMLILALLPYAGRSFKWNVTAASSSARTQPE
jgi:glycosyltransferase involved in cell wall biosynthesis